MNVISTSATREAFIRHFYWRSIYFALSICLVVLVFRTPLTTLISLGLGSGHEADQYSQIAVMPLICFYLVFRKRRRIFADVAWSFAYGFIVLGFGVALFLTTKLIPFEFDQHNLFILPMIALVVLILGSFLIFFGTQSFRQARFALLTLILMIPFPTWLLDRTISFLQQGSAAVTTFLLNLTPMPFVREGLVFHLPTNLNIFIADDCSGIRSSIALLIASLVASDVFLQKGWSKLALNLAVLPLSLFKNGFRIATLSLLSVYVDRGFMFSDLHRDGGIVFYLIACAVLTVFLWRLWKLERKTLPKIASLSSIPNAKVQTAESLHH